MTKALLAFLLRHVRQPLLVRTARSFSFFTCINLLCFLRGLKVVVGSKIEVRDKRQNDFWDLLTFLIYGSRTARVLPAYRREFALEKEAKIS